MSAQARNEARRGARLLVCERLADPGWAVVERLWALRWPGESFSDVILALAKGG